MVFTIDKMAKESFIDQVTVEQEPEGGKGGRHMTSGRSVPEKETTKVSRLGLLEQLQRDQYGQSTRGEWQKTKSGQLGEVILKIPHDHVEHFKDFSVYSGWDSVDSIQQRSGMI